MKKEQFHWIDTRDKPGLLFAMMNQFNVNAHISLEGDLKDLSFFDSEASSKDETEALQRQTESPELDFVVLPLNNETIKAIWKELTEKDHLVNEGIIHVQIESYGKLAFGGYDNFHKECVVAYKSVPIELLASLKEKGIIRNYEQESA